MSVPRYFSDRAELSKPPDGLLREEIPGRVRNAVRNWLASDGTDTVYDWTRLWHFMVDQLEFDPDTKKDNYQYCQHILNEYLSQSRWFEFLDACEVIYRWLASGRHRDVDGFVNRLREALLRFYSAYEIEADGTIRSVGSRASGRAVAEARALLRDPRLKGPDRDFQAALRASQRRPSPDHAQAISKALGAVEGAVRIALGGKRKSRFGPAIRKIGRDHDLPPPLVASIENLWGYASGPGIRHGSLDTSEVDPSVAEFCLHQAAATIVLVGRLYGFGVGEGSAETA